MNVLPCMTLQRTYEALAEWLVCLGWRRERHWFYPPGSDAPYPLEAAVQLEATGGDLTQKRGRR